MPPTVVFVPCFSGAPWDLRPFGMLGSWPVRLLTLPSTDDLEAYGDWLQEATADLERFVLLGDSFGAAIALSLASRSPRGLVAVAASGGFACNPLRQASLAFMARNGPHLAGGLYEQVVLPFHGRLLASPFDRTGEHPWGIEDTVRLFRAHTPASDYWSRARAAVNYDLRPRLGAIRVPTLLLSPADDRLIAKRSSAPLGGIPGARQLRLPGTGHMFRFSHPMLYGNAIRTFLDEVASDGTK